MTHSALSVRLSVRFVAMLGLLTMLVECKRTSVPVPIDANSTRDDNLAMGNPDGATGSINTTTYLITQSTYSLSYN